MGLGNPMPANLPAECKKATKIFQSFVSPVGIDKLIPSSVLRQAHGFAIFTVVKAGFIISARAGTGIVIARLSNGGWSAPSAIGTAGVGFGGQAGGEVTEFIVVLNSKSAVRQFMAAGSLTLGGNMSIAVGPMGRNAEGSGALNTKGKMAAMYSYSKTKGLFGGVSVEGSAIVEREDCNAKAYGGNVKATQLLSGQIDVPPFAGPLIDILSARAGGAHNPHDDAGGMSRQDDQGADSSPGTPNGYSFGGDNPFATGGASGKAGKNKSKRGLSIGSWKSGDSGGNRSRSNTLTAPQRWDPIGSTKLSEDEEEGHNGHHNGTVSGGRYNSSSFGNGQSRRESVSRTNPLNPFPSRKVELETTPILEQDRFDFSHSRDTSHSEAEDDERYRGRSFDSFDGSRPIDQDLSLNGASPSPKQQAKKPSFPPSDWKISKGGNDDLMSFDARSPGAEEYYSTSTQWRRPDSIGDDEVNRYSPPSSPPMIRPSPGPSRSGSAFGFGRKKKTQDSTDTGDFIITPKAPSFERTDTASVGGLGKAVGLWDFQGQESEDLTFKKGDVITILKKSDDQWWTGSIGMRTGIFPLTHVEVQTSS